jgi:chromosome condensin MukBEF MukE localization factor
MTKKQASIPKSTLEYCCVRFQMLNSNVSVVEVVIKAHIVYLSVHVHRLARQHIFANQGLYSSKSEK